MTVNPLNFYRSKCILVTGGTGSIGSQVVEQLLDAGAGVVRILSRDETRQLEFQERLEGRVGLDRTRFLIGDVRDPVRLRRAMESVDVVFHAAAMKHVPACEYNPFEAVQTNVIGTRNIITASREAGVERVVVISTDKATSPENTLGATKLLGERLVAAAHTFSKSQILCAVRFGNVIGSRGSLAPRVLKQLEDEGSARLTHSEMTRFMMTIQDAVSLVLEAGVRATGGDIFILDMPALKVRDLIEVLVETHAARVGKTPDSFPIHLTGARPGEKLHERLVTEDEMRRTRLVRDGLYVVDPQDQEQPTEYQELAKDLDSSKVPLLTKPEIRDLLFRARVLDEARDRAVVLESNPEPAVVTA